MNTMKYEDMAIVVMAIALDRYFLRKTRPGVQQCQAQGLVFCPWIGSS